MQISGEGNNQDLSSVTLSKLGGLTTTNYPLKDQVRAMNQALRIIWAVIFQAYGGWQFDDDNQTGTPSTTASLTTNADITLPSSALTVRGMEITDSNGVVSKLIAATFEEIQQKMAFGEFQRVDSIPRFYIPVGDTILLKPQLSSGTYTYTIYYDRGIVDIAYNATTTVPGFASQFHEALAVFAALDYARSNPDGMEKRIVSLEREWLNYVGDEARGIKGTIAKFYSKRYFDLFPPKLNVGQNNISDYE